jgi:hypothetical protein
MRLFRLVLIVAIFLFAACSSLVLKPADFAWPIESVLDVDEEGFVQEERYSLSFNVKGLFFEENGDSTAFLDQNIRIIRNTEGYYFVTSQNFKCVYVFKGIDGAMNIDNKIEINEKGMNGPVLNQRPPYVELIYNGERILLSNKGIENEESNEK